MQARRGGAGKVREGLVGERCSSRLDALRDWFVRDWLDLRRTCAGLLLHLRWTYAGLLLDSRWPQAANTDTVQVIARKPQRAKPHRRCHQQPAPSRAPGRPVSAILAAVALHGLCLSQHIPPICLQPQSTPVIARPHDRDLLTGSARPCP